MECVGTKYLRGPIIDEWAVRGPWKRRTDAFSPGGEFTHLEKGLSGSIEGSQFSPGRSGNELINVQGYL
jgi:hypothetical protein